MDYKKTFWFALAFLGFINISFSQTVLTTLDPAVRDISEVYFGFNRRSDRGPLFWTNNSFINLVAEMNPDIVRYPAGTQGNYWDWRKGEMLANAGIINNNKEVVTIPTFLAGLPSRTQVTYTVNIARPTPITGVSVNASEKILKSTATLNLKIADILAAIDEFVAQGKKPYAVEIGNEIHFGLDHVGIFHNRENENTEEGGYLSGWDYETDKPIRSETRQAGTIVNALFYLKQCKAVVEAIRERYPNIKIGIPVGNSGSPVREQWNETILDNLKNNPDYASLSANIDALVIHVYINKEFGGFRGTITDDTTAKIAIAEAIQISEEKQLDYNVMPDNYQIWYSEFGEVKLTAEDTWAAGVRYAAFNYGLLNLGSKADIFGYHHITDNNVIKVNDNDETQMRFAPIGIATKLLMKARAEMTEMQKIDFDTNPISANDAKFLYGFKFISDSKETLFIININNIDFTDLNINSLINYSGERKLTQYNSDAPYVSSVSDGDSNIVSTNSTVSNTFNAKRFSISVIEVEKTLGVDDISVNKINIYPNPVNDVLTIQSEDVLKSISVFSLNGTNVLMTKNIAGDRVNLSALKTGFYFIKIETEKGIEFKKIIKN